VPDCGQQFPLLCHLCLPEAFAAAWTPLKSFGLDSETDNHYISATSNLEKVVQSPEKADRNYLRLRKYKSKYLPTEKQTFTSAVVNYQPLVQWPVQC
jgi:hypothetical protein